MQTEIRMVNATLKLEQEPMIQRHIDFALRKVRHRIGSLVVRLEDLNGPKGGIDKRCQIEAYLWRSGMLLSQAIDVDFAPAAKRAAERIARQVLEQTRRRRSRRLAGMR